MEAHGMRKSTEGREERDWMRRYERKGVRDGTSR